MLEGVPAAETLTTNNQQGPPVPQVSKLSTCSSKHAFFMRNSNSIFESLRQHQKKRRAKIAKVGDTVMENNLKCIQVSAILAFSSYKENILAFSADGRLFSWDSESKRVGWSVSVGKPLHVYHRCSENDFSYLSMVGGARKLYKHAKNNEPEELPWNADKLADDPKKYKDGNLKCIKTPTVIHVDPVTGRLFNDVTRDFYEDGKIHFIRYDYELTCYDPESHILLWYLRFADFEALLKNNNKPKGQNVQTPGTTLHISWHGEGVDKNGNIIKLAEYKLPIVVLNIVKGQSADQVVEKEVSIIKDVCDGNINLRNVFDVVSDNKYHNVATEECNTSLIQFMESMFKKKKFKFMESSDKDKKTLLKLIRGIVSGLISLHDNGIFLGNLDISKIFVDRHSNVKISVISENTVFPLISPLHSATDDVLALGRLIFFILSGEEYDEDNADLTNPIFGTEASDLLMKILNEGPTSRQTALQVWSHPLFWDPSKKLDFISTVSEHLESESPKSKLSKAIKGIGKIVFGTEWGTCLDVEVCNAVEKGAFTKYYNQYLSMYYLIRFIRNLKTHRTRITVEINSKKIVSPEVREMFKTGEFGSYFFDRFPKLVMEVYQIMKRKRGEDIKFCNYFKAQINETNIYLFPY